IRDRFTAKTELDKPLSNGTSFNQRTNDTLNRTRLIVALARARRWPDVSHEVSELRERVGGDVVSFLNLQVNAPCRTALALAVACDDSTTALESEVHFLRAISLMQQLDLKTELIRDSVCDHTFPFTERLEGARKQRLLNLITPSRSE
ncbi:MAG: hypothetical protein AB8G99_04635, partial [Planctomycetaceae bacterium]